MAWPTLSVVLCASLFAVSSANVNFTNIVVNGNGCVVQDGKIWQNGVGRELAPHEKAEHDRFLQSMTNYQQEMQRISQHYAQQMSTFNYASGQAPPRMPPLPTLPQPPPFCQGPAVSYVNPNGSRTTSNSYTVMGFNHWSSGGSFGGPCYGQTLGQPCQLPAGYQAGQPAAGGQPTYAQVSQAYTAGQPCVVRAPADQRVGGGCLNVAPQPQYQREPQPQLQRAYTASQPCVVAAPAGQQPLRQASGGCYSTQPQTAGQIPQPVVEPAYQRVQEYTPVQEQHSVQQAQSSEGQGASYTEQHQPDNQASSEPCADANASCPSWAARGDFCGNDQHAHLHQQCRRSCRLC
ncbi:hypothetical protein AAVH_07312 [Aphelenchoides avenae]|nr:hypothetical protein AAVH_07312 [Aphelenchus avenae]